MIKHYCNTCSEQFFPDSEHNEFAPHYVCSNLCYYEAEEIRLTGEIDSQAEKINSLKEHMAGVKPALFASVLASEERVLNYLKEELTDITGVTS